MNIVIDKAYIYIYIWMLINSTNTYYVYVYNVYMHIYIGLFLEKWKSKHINIEICLGDGLVLWRKIRQGKHTTVADKESEPFCRYYAWEESF